MTIDRFNDIYVPVCDNCGNELPGEFDFYDAVEAKKAAGWKSVKINGGWEDWCDVCKERSRT